MLLRRTFTHLLAIPVVLAAIAIACDEDDIADPPGTQIPTDTQPPQPIDNLALAFDSTTEAVIFTWTARRDDTLRARANHYDIRYGDAFPLDWVTSTRVADPPAPLDDGDIQQYELAGLQRGRDLYAAMRAVDAAGNQSPVASVAHLRVPGFSYAAYCYDVFSASPIEGLEATVTTRRIDQLATGADGRVHLADLEAGMLSVHLSRGSASTAYHSFDDAFNLGDDTSLMYAMVPFQQPQSPLYSSVLSLLRTANSSPGSAKIIKRWRSYPVSWYAPSFVNVNGLDYRDLASRAAERWNTRLGFHMFEPVSSDPATGVLMEFVPHGSIGTANGITEYTNDAEGYPLHDRIRIVDNFADEPRLYSIFMHELGHTIPLVHLEAGFIMFGGQPLPNDISDDEVLLVRLMLALPNGTSLLKYDADPPAR